MDAFYLNFIWLGVAVLFALIEAASPMLVCIWFCGGAVLSFAVSFFVPDPVIQLIVFVLASVVLLLACRPFFRHRVAQHGSKETDVDAMVGRTVTVTQAITAGEGGRGRALLADTTWNARTVDARPLPTGSHARIVAVEGTWLLLSSEAADTPGPAARA